MQPKTFDAHLRITQKESGDYEVFFESMFVMSKTKILASEVESIHEGCRLMAKTLTDRYREELFAATDPGIL